MDQELRGILEFLERREIRATYQAVGEAIGVSARGVGAMLGERNPRASWVVSADTGKPTGYEPEQEHPALYNNPQIIRTGADLRRRMNLEVLQ